jgi:hypothetical protein
MDHLDEQYFWSDSAGVAQELWQRKQTSPSGYTLGISSFTAIIPGHPVDNYYIYILHILHDDVHVHLQ